MINSQISSFHFLQYLTITVSAREDVKSYRICTLRLDLILKKDPWSYEICALSNSIDFFNRFIMLARIWEKCLLSLYALCIQLNSTHTIWYMRSRRPECPVRSLFIKLHLLRLSLRSYVFLSTLGFPLPYGPIPYFIWICGRIQRLSQSEYHWGLLDLSLD